MPGGAHGSGNSSDGAHVPVPTTDPSASTATDLTVQVGLESGHPALTRIAELAAQLTGASAGQIALVREDQRIVAGAGAAASEVGRRYPLEQAVCTITVAAEEALVVPDTRRDARTASKAPVLAGTVGSYLGVPLSGADQRVVGTLCVYEPTPRAWTQAEVDSVEQLGATVVAELEASAALGRLRDHHPEVELALAAAGVGVFEDDLSGQLHRWDERTLALFGFSRENLDAGVDLEQRVHPDDRARVRDAVQRALSGQHAGAYSAEFRVVLPDGRTRWIAARGRVVRERDGSRARLVGTAQDATVMRARADQVTQVLESMAVGYLTTDSEWRITYVNTAAEQIARSPRADLVGRSFWEAFPAALDTDFERHYRRAVATGEQVTFDAFYPAPLDVWVEVRAVPEAGGLALYFLDVTDRYAAQRAAQASAAQISALAEVALAMVDLEDVTDLVTVIAERGMAALGADGGSVAVHDLSDPESLLVYVTASYGPGVQADYAHLPLQADLPACEAARTGTRVLLSDREACRAYSPEMADGAVSTGSQAFASLPMRADGRVIAVVTAAWDTPQVFPPAQVELLEAFAAQCAQALQRLQSRDAERRAAAAEQRAGDLARTSAARQGALVTIARALADAATQDDVLDVLAGQGADLLGANGCGICLRTEDGQHVDTVVTDSYAEVRHTVQRTRADFPLPAIRAAATGQAIYLPDREQTEQAFPGSQAIYAGAGVQASAAVPLRARGRLLGCLSVGFAEARHFSDDERELLTAFAALTAQALDRIAAHESEQAALVEVASIAETLQRSMLTAPPEPDHLQLAVRYAATAESAEVGGDWYDAFLTADGVTTLVIGDVTGHDMAAAAVMGQLRNLLRGIAYTLGEPPALVLTALDRAAAGLGIDTVATAVLAQVEQDEAHRAAGTRLLRWSSAGHLPPLLLEADGTTRFLDAPSDLVLGWDPRVERHDHEHVLAPGSTVLLYTDGLVERRGVGLDRGLAWLAEAAAQMAGAPLEELCDALVELVGEHLDDDVALLALRAHPEDAPRPAEAGPEQLPPGLGAAQVAAGQDGA